MSTPVMTSSAAFPRVAQKRLRRISAGWIVVALAHALAYTVLALAIIHSWSALPVLLAAAVVLALTVVCSRAGYLSGARLAGDLYRALGDGIAHAKLSWFTQANRALITRVAGEGIPTFMGVPAHQLQTFILTPLVPVLLIASISYVGGILAGILSAALLALSLCAQYVCQRSLARADEQRQEHARDGAQATLELVEHIELFRTAAGPARGLARAESSWAAQEEALARTNRAALPATFISALASTLPLAGMLIYLSWPTTTVTPAVTLALIMLTARASAPLDELALAGLAIGDLRAGVKSYLRIVGAPRLVEPKDDSAARVADEGFELADLTAPPALYEVNAVIPPGKRTHIAGPTGAGKSTLLRLLMRFDDPASGQVRLGGVALSELSEEARARHIAYVPQDPVVFTGSLAENIRLGRPEASDEEVFATAKIAALDDLLERDHRGIHQQVGRYGAGLSGGERQRVGIARALIKGAPIVILDEATSALDQATEERIAEAICSLDATVVFVTHRSADMWQPHHRIELPVPSLRS